MELHQDILAASIAVQLLQCTLGDPCERVQHHWSSMQPQGPVAGSRNLPGAKTLCLVAPDTTTS